MMPNNPAGRNSRLTERWWVMILAGLVSLYGAFWFHGYLTHFEQGEQWIGLTWPLWLLYNSLGKWGIVGLCLVACPVFIAYGIHLRNRRKR